jgi:hypothetical protein
MTNQHIRSERAAFRLFGKKIEILANKYICD